MHVRILDYDSRLWTNMHELLGCLFAVFYELNTQLVIVMLTSSLQPGSYSQWYQAGTVPRATRMRA